VGVAATLSILVKRLTRSGIVVPPSRPFGCTSPRAVSRLATACHRTVPEQPTVAPVVSATDAFRHVRDRAPDGTSQRIEPASLRGAHHYRSLDRSTTCGDEAPISCSSFASHDPRGAFAGRPSPRSSTCDRGAHDGASRSWSDRSSWCLRRRPVRETGMCGVRLRTLPAAGRERAPDPWDS
jgi:hypothetical protein